MKRVLAVLVLFGASAASGQELTSVPALQDVGASMRALKSAAETAPGEPIEYAHRLGHSTPPIEAGETPDVSPYPVRGVDVSHYEGAVQWDKVKAAGVAFAYAKATEGDTYVDDTFAADWRGAADHGLLRGAYHFYNFCDKGADQADNFIKTVRREDGALPVVVDLEQSNDCARMPARAAFLKDLAAFVRKVEAAYGLTPILYVNLSIYDQYLSGASAGYRLWIADPSHKSPQMPAGRDWAFWQYSWHGSVPGIGAETDLDVFNGDAKALSLLTRP
jgi:lysozyme